MDGNKRHRQERFCLLQLIDLKTDYTQVKSLFHLELPVDNAGYVSSVETKDNGFIVACDSFHTVRNAAYDSNTVLQTNT